MHAKIPEYNTVTINQLEQKVAHLEQQKQNQEQVIQQKDAELQRIRADWDVKSNEIWTQYMNELQAQNDICETHIAEMQHMAQELIQHKKEISTLQNQLQSSHQNEETHQKEKREMQKSHTDELRRWQTKDAEMQEHAAQQVTTLRAVQKELQDQNNEHEAQIVEMHEEFTKQQKEMLKQHETQLKKDKNEIQRLQQKHVEMEKHATTTLTQVQAHFGEALLKQKECDARIVEIERTAHDAFTKQQEDTKRMQKTHESQLKNAQRHKEQHEIEKARLEQQLQHLEKQGTEWKQQMQTISQQHIQLASELQRINEDNTATREEVKQKEAEIQKLNAVLEALQSENTTLTKTLGDQSNISDHTIDHLQELQRTNAILTARSHECETQIAVLDREKAKMRQNLKEMAHVQDENARLRRETAPDRLQLENKRLQEDAQAKAQEAAALKIELERAQTVAKEPKKIEEFTDNEMVHLLSATFLSGCISNLPK